VNRQGQNLRLWSTFLDLSDGLNPIHLRHGEVRQDKIGSEFLHPPNGLSAIFCLPYHFEIRFSGKQGPQPLSKNRMILGNNDSAFYFHQFHLSIELAVFCQNTI
jgi:hypothetical protein